MLRLSRVRLARLLLTMVAIVVVAPWTSTQADEVTETFVVGDPFFFGVPGTNPGQQTSLMNSFPEGLANQGRVRITNAHSVQAGLGNVLFTANSSPLTQLDVDFGNVETITRPGATLLSTQFLLDDIDFDADSDMFSFEITANLLVNGPANKVADFDITAVDATYSITAIDEGLFGVEVTRVGAGKSSLTITGGNGLIIQSLSFRDINADVLNDELSLVSSRTFLAVPEPGFVGLALCSTLGLMARRRRQR